jgi:argininosuccinate synthase
MGLKDQMAQRYAHMLYEGRWWTPEREALDAMVSVLMRDVTGVVKLKLFKGSAWAVSRTSPRSLYREDLATFGEAETYDHADAEGFIKLFGLPIRAAAGRDGTGSSEANAVSELLREVLGASAV